MPYYAYVSLQHDDRIRVFTMDADTGKLTQKEDVEVSGGPAALAIDPGKRHLYVGRRGTLDIASFRIDQTSGGITQIGSAPLQGEPVAMTTDRKGNFILFAQKKSSRIFNLKTHVSYFFYNSLANVGRRF